MRKIVAGYLLFFSIMFIMLFGNRLYILRGTDAFKYHDTDGVSYVSRIQGKQFEVYDGHENWVSLFIAGVNIGAAKPGYFPGEFGITHDDYLRWFKQIGELGVNTIRVYVAQMPGFYHALSEYNGTTEHPLYLLHGIYINEADVEEYYDAYKDEKIINDFKADIRNVIDIIHGNASVKKTKGNADGVYTADISQYVIGLIPGIEWEAGFVTGTNENNPQKTDYDGAYLYTQDASPFEVFLAEAVDEAIAYEAKKYGEQRPVAVSNWVTTDPLEHPNEPNPEVEDAVSVNVEHIHAKDGYKPGFFASYHVYPYYPDLFNYEVKYLTDGNTNTYRAYIEELNAFHSMPVLISEVGIPASRGIAHENTLSGFNQGYMEESEQGVTIASLIDDIKNEGLMGALIFSWQDEWFKKTWNTMNLDVADRRPYWMDYQTNEQNFGLLAFDPGKTSSICYVDGDTAEWSVENLVVENGDYKLYAIADEKFLYLMVEVKDFDHETLYIPLDVIPGQGNSEYSGVSLGGGADFLIEISGQNGSRVLVDAYYDPTYYEYAVKSQIIERNPLLEQKGGNLFVPVTLMLSRGLYLPQTDESIPYETFDTGKLLYGIANPSLPGYNSIADFCHENGKVEIRLPWLLLNVVDPSQGQILGDFYENNAFIPQDAQPFQIGIVNAEGADGAGWSQYSWPHWETPSYHERLKSSYYILQDYFQAVQPGYASQRSGFEIFWSRWNNTAFSKIAYWFPIQPILNYMLAFLLSIILYFFLVLLHLHVSSHIRGLRQRKLMVGISEAVDLYLSGETGKAVRQMKSTRLLTKKRLLVVSESFESGDESRAQILRSLLLEVGYAGFISRQINAKNEAVLISAIRLAGFMGLGELSPRVSETVYIHKKNIDIQYQGFLTLSLLGAYEQIVAIGMDGGFVHTLSFRSLQEILKAYTGDKSALYETLLHSPDSFVVRICIKRIGVERFTHLVEKIMPFLESGDDNIVMDAARALGQLRSRDSAPGLAALARRERWEIRSIAVEAIGSIDCDEYESVLTNALHDREWQVRFHAANALKDSRNIDNVICAIKDSEDKYAYEVLDYCIHNAALVKEAAV